jgi:hypothetical protein
MKDSKEKPQVSLLIRDQEVALTKWLGVRGARITPCALILPKDIDFETWAAMGPKLGKLKRFSTWAVADWLATGEIVFNETYSQACDTTGLDPAYLMVLRHVASKVAPERRRESLSFTHHRLVAPLEPDEQTKLLDLAETQNWSREELTAAVKAFNKNIEEPERGEPDVERVFYRQELDHGALVLENSPIDVREIAQRAVELLESELVGASAEEKAQVLATINEHFSYCDQSGFNRQSGN